METIHTARVNMYNFELPNNFQSYYDKIQKEGKVFRVEEYYNDTMTVVVNGAEIYMYRTKEVENDPTGSGYTQCTLSRAYDLDDLYNSMRVNRNILELDEIKEIFRDIEGYVNSR